MPYGKDDIVVSYAPKDSAIATAGAEQKQKYLPETPVVSEGIKRRWERVMEPTIASKIATSPAAKKIGSIPEAIVSAPERALRLAAIPAGVGVDVLSGGMSLADAMLGKIPSKVLGPVVTPLARKISEKIPETIKRDPTMQAAGDVAGAFALAKAPKVATETVKASQVPVRAAGEFAVRPKMQSYIEGAKEVSAKRLGETTAEQAKNAVKILSDEGIYNITNPQKLNYNITTKANQLAGAAFKSAYDASNKGLPPVSNAVSQIKEKILKELELGQLGGKEFPIDEIPRAKRVLEQMSREWENKGFNKNLPQEALITYKRNLGVKWNKGSAIQPPPVENIKNSLRKAAYYAADDLITDPTTQALLKRSSDLYKVGEIVGGKGITAQGVLTGTALAGIPPLVGQMVGAIPGAPGSAGTLGILAGLGLGGQALYKSGLPGEAVLRLGSIGKAPKPVPPSLPYATQQRLRELTMNRPDLNEYFYAGQFGRIYPHTRRP